MTLTTSLPPNAPAAPSGSAPSLQGRYDLAEMIGRGGMATVYRALDTALDRAVAVKLLHPSISNEPEFVDQFLAMERRIARLFHPNLVTIFDAGRSDAGCFVVMEYVPGGSLRELLERGRLLPIAEVVKIVAQVAGALELLHSERIVHGDVKPDNVLLDEQGDAKLVDFGIARLATTSRVIKSESIGGSAPYLAPEQLTTGQSDARSDIYALGLVAYELLAGRKAFDGENWVAVAAARLARDPHPLERLRPELPKELARTIMRALAREPGRRYPTAEHFRRALLATLPSESSRRVAGPARPTRPSRPATTLPWRRLTRRASSDAATPTAATQPGPLAADRAEVRPVDESGRPVATESALVRFISGRHPASTMLLGVTAIIDLLLLSVILRLVAA